MMNLPEYLKKIKVESVDSLTDKQVEDFFVSKDMDIQTKVSVKLALKCVKDGIFEKKDIIKSMRKSMVTNDSFRCGFIDNESANGGDDTTIKSGWILKP